MTSWAVSVTWSLLLVRPLGTVSVTQFPPSAWAVSVTLAVDDAVGGVGDVVPAVDAPWEAPVHAVDAPAAVDEPTGPVRRHLLNTDKETFSWAHQSSNPWPRRHPKSCR